MAGDVPDARLQQLLILSAVTATLLGVGLALGLTQMIVRPMRRLASTANQIAPGDLNGRIELHRQDEIGRAAAAFDQMVGSPSRAASMLRFFV